MNEPVHHETRLVEPSRKAEVVPTLNLLANGLSRQIGPAKIRQSRVIDDDIG